MFVLTCLGGKIALKQNICGPCLSSFLLIQYDNLVEHMLYVCHTHESRYLDTPFFPEFKNVLKIFSSLELGFHIIENVCVFFSFSFCIT